MATSVDYKKATSIYDFTVQDSFGNDINLAQYKGNVVLVVNIASKCGLTKSNYEKLTELNKKYGDAGKEKTIKGLLLAKRYNSVSLKFR